MRKVMHALKAVFQRDPNRPTVAKLADVGLVEAQSRNSLAADNLRETLSELLEESDRLHLRPVFLAGPRTRK